MGKSTIRKSALFWLLVLLCSPVLVPVMILQAFGFLKVKPFSWDTFAADRDVPLRRWSRCVKSVYANDTSNRSAEPANAAEGLAKGWNIRDPERYSAMASALSTQDEEDLAWNLGRLIGVCRSAMVVGYTTEDEGWALIRQCADRLREKYRSWDELAQAMREGLDRQAEVQPEPWNEPARKLMSENVENLKKTLWSDTPWDLDFDS
jgi:hypothetical protein